MGGNGWLAPSLLFYARVNGVREASTDSRDA